jgi:DUF218 domain
MSNPVYQKITFFKVRLFKPREVWLPTFHGWLVALALIMSLMVGAILNVHPFLAPRIPLKSANLLVVEGWLPDYALEQAASEFNKGSYELIVSTGGALERGTYIANFHNFADVSAETLKKIGVPSDKVIAVSAPEVVRDRSFEAAATFAHWLEKSQLNVHSINLVSLGAHTRRSWYLYQKILKPKIKVGVIAAENRDYNADKWWASSSGVRDVIDEGIAYIYARYLNWKA